MDSSNFSEFLAGVKSDLIEWSSRIVEKCRSCVNFDGYEKIPSLISELPSVLPPPRISRILGLRTTRQLVVFRSLFLMVTITIVFYILNSSTTYRTLLYREPQYSSNQKYCEKYTGQTADLNRTFDILSQYIPPEDQWEDLMKPSAQGAGAPLAHDVALKAREYSKLFTPWAELHLSSGQHALYLREDMMQYLQCQANSVTPIQGVNQSQILRTIQLYDSYRTLVANMGQTLFPWTAPFFSDHLSLYTQIKNGGKGIVFTVGNNHVSFIQTSIVTMRQLGCKLPIEVMYFGDGDLSPSMRQKIESYPGVVTRNLNHMVNTNGWKLEGFDMKAFAMMVSSFSEVILVDADVGFLKNPEILFLDEGYTETGTLFFYDRILGVDHSHQKWLLTALPAPLSSRMNEKISMEGIGAIRGEQESGVVVFNKSRHFIPMLLILWLNGPNKHGDAINKGFYDTFWGDKDSYWMGMEMAGNLEYSFGNGSVACAGNISQAADYIDDQATKETKKIGEHAYNFSGVVYTSKSSPHYGRTVSIFDRDFKMCSYQMIHMVRDQTPLWYNGWISEQKKPTLLMKNLWEFEHYMLENPNPTGTSPWTWGQNYKGCLGGRELISFTKSEKKVFQNARQAAIDLGIVTDH